MTFPGSLSTGAAYPLAFPAGGATSSVVPQTYPASIDGHGYMVDWTKFQRQHLDTQRPAFDNAGEPGEQTLSPQAFWRRSQSRFDLGAGQRFFDNEQSDVFPQPFFGSARQRFWESKGLNPWDGDGMSLLPAVEQLGSDTAETNLLTLTVGDFGYYVIGNTINWIDFATPAVDTVTLPQDPTSITTDGTNVYIAYGGSEAADYLEIGDDTLAAYGVLTPDFLRYANGRMIAALGGELVELDNAGVKVGDSLVVPQFGGTWVDIIGSPVGIFAALNVGDYRGELYVVDVDGETGALLPGVFAGRLPNGELFNSLYFYGGSIVAGTSLGIRVFELGGQQGQTANMQPLIEISGGVTAMAGLGEFVWFGWSNYDSVSTGLGRLRMSRTTDPDGIVPPYASDLMAGVTGAPVQGTVASIAILPQRDNQIIFSVAGKGFFSSDDSGALVNSGTLDSGWVRFGTLAEKSIAGVELGHDPLDGTISVTLVDFNGGSDEIGVSDTSGATFSEIFGTSKKTRAVRVQLTVTRDGSDDTVGPTLRWWTLLGYPAPPRSQEIVLPVVLTDMVKPYNRDLPVDVVSENEHLERLASSGQLVTLQILDRSWQVIVTGIVEDQDKTRYQPDLNRPTTRRWLQGVVYVRMLTKES